MGMMTSQQRDRLDAKVRAMHWDADACAWGSRQRMQVAALVEATPLVEGEIRRLFPDPGQAERMIEYIKPRITEKIVGREIVSHSANWNKHNLWDPTLNTSVCGWVRRLTVAMAKANPRRILHGHTLPASTWESEDGYNPVFDDANSENVLIGHPLCGIFDEHPGLRVPRPVGGPGPEWWRRLQHKGDAGVVRDSMRAAGMWDTSLDVLDPLPACALVCAPLPSVRASLLPRLYEPGSVWEQLAIEYWPTQTTGRPGAQRLRQLRQLVEHTAQTDHVFEWDVWVRLGTMTARLLAD